MKLILFALSLIFSLNSQADTPDREAASLPLRHYLKAHATGDPAYIRLAFSSDAMITGYLQGQLISLNREQFAQRFSGKAPEDEAQRQRHFEILDLSPDAGVARVVLDYPKVKFIDYMSLLKVNGEWKIVNKTFNTEYKTPVSK